MTDLGQAFDGHAFADERCARSLPAGSEFAGCEIGELIGRGGMGLVYRARERNPDREVALKVISPELASAGHFRARFAREAKLLAALEHHNVIPVYRVGEEGGALYIVMRIVRGTDLGGLLRARGPLTAVNAAHFIAQIAAALDAAHALGLVHRDIKPANVLVDGAAPDEHLYLTDFGISRQISEVGPRLTATGAFVGTLNYIAPEQLRGDPPDARVDVYALGCVLHELLTGLVPFPREQDAARIAAHLAAPPPVPSEILPGISGELDAVVARALAKDPAARFQSAGALARAAAAAATSATGGVRARAAATTLDAAPPAPTTDKTGPGAERTDTRERSAVRINNAGGSIYERNSIVVKGDWHG